MSNIQLVAQLGAFVAIMGVFLTLVLRTIRAEIGGLDAKVSAEIGGLDAKLSARIDALDEKFSGRIEALEEKLSTRIDGIERQLNHLDRDVQGLYRRDFQ